MVKQRIEWQENTSRESSEELARLLGVSPLLTGVLVSRGFTEEEALRSFLYGKAEPYYDPYAMRGMAEAVARVRQALERSEKITIYGDYDVDGITASSLLLLYLKEKGVQVNVYIPKRADEGYGLNSEALEHIYAEGTTLLITVDCGISGAVQVATAPKGLDIIITDHHTPPEKLPQALVIINPHQKGDNYPCKYLSGVGVAFKLCQALERSFAPNAPYWEKYIELVALGTVADIVPLLDENREIVRRGLAQLKVTANIGLTELIKLLNLGERELTSDTVAFGIAPRLNAVGRLEHAMSAVRLLTTECIAEAQTLAQHLDAENTERKALSEQIFTEAEEMLRKRKSIGHAIVLGKASWHAGVIGIVASRLVEKYHVPTILLTEGPLESKGSCRSIEPLNLYAALYGCKEYLLQFGGHRQAAGLTIRTERLKDFALAFTRQVESMLREEDFLDKEVPDYVVPSGESITTQTVKDLALLEPCGAMNEAPVFAFPEAEITRAYLLGKDGAHVKLYLRQGMQQYKALLWREGSNIYTYYSGQQCACAFQPKLNVFRGEESVDLQLTALMSAKHIYDYRYAKETKNVLLAHLLLTHKRALILLRGNPELVAAEVGEECVIASYTDGLELACDYETVVFYDLPPSDLFTAATFPLKGEGTLVLLYNREDVVRQSAALSRRYPDKAGMAACYRYLRQCLRTQGIVKLSTLLDHGKTKEVYFTEDIVRVFAELNFIKLYNDTISINVEEKTDIANSPTYQKMLRQKSHYLKVMDYVMKIAPANIVRLWQ